MNEIIQKEFDIAEAHLLECLFKSSTNPQINTTVASFLALQGKSLTTMLNAAILEGEAYIQPWLTSEGYVDGSKLALLVKNKFGKDIAIPDFRMVELIKALEPALKFLSKFIQ